MKGPQPHDAAWIAALEQHEHAAGETRNAGEDSSTLEDNEEFQQMKRCLDVLQQMWPSARPVGGTFPRSFGDWTLHQKLGGGGFGDPLERDVERVRRDPNGFAIDSWE